MDDWDDEHIPEILKKMEPKGSWDDEDLDEDGIKESWDDEDDPAPAPKPQPPAEKNLKKPSGKATEKKGKAVEVTNTEEVLDPAAEKLRQQRLVEEDGYNRMKELFATQSDEKTLENFIPKSETNFQKYAELISHKLRPYEKSFHYIGLLKVVMRLSTNALKGQDVKEIASSVTAIANEKIKAEKEANKGKKKTGGKKKKLVVDREDDDAVVNAYDGYDGYDSIYEDPGECVQIPFLEIDHDQNYTVILFFLEINQ